jgi:hypothetical protein
MVLKLQAPSRMQALSWNAWSSKTERGNDRKRIETFAARAEGQAVEESVVGILLWSQTVAVSYRCKHVNNINTTSKELLSGLSKNPSTFTLLPAKCTKLYQGAVVPDSHSFAFSEKLARKEKCNIVLKYDAQRSSESLKSYNRFSKLCDTSSIVFMHWIARFHIHSNS